MENSLAQATTVGVGLFDELVRLVTKAAAGVAAVVQYFDQITCGAVVSESCFFFYQLDSFYSRIFYFIGKIIRHNNFRKILF